MSLSLKLLTTLSAGLLASSCATVRPYPVYPFVASRYAQDAPIPLDGTNSFVVQAAANDIYFARQGHACRSSGRLLILGADDSAAFAEQQK